MVGKGAREVKNIKLMGLGSLVVALIIVACCPTPTTCPVVDTAACEATVTKLAGQSRALGTQVAACNATSTKTAEYALATITALETQLAGCCEEGPTATPCPEAIPAEQAVSYVGEVKTVQGTIVDTRFASGSSGQPTFLNFCRPYPNHCFTALIWGDDRQEFIDCVGGLPEVILLNREICVKGLIELYDGIPEIILKECHQLAVLQ